MKNIIIKIAIGAAVSLGAMLILNSASITTMALLLVEEPSLPSIISKARAPLPTIPTPPAASSRPGPAVEPTARAITDPELSPLGQFVTPEKRCMNCGAWEPNEQRLLEHRCRRREPSDKPISSRAGPSSPVCPAPSPEPKTEPAPVGANALCTNCRMPIRLPLSARQMRVCKACGGYYHPARARLLFDTSTYRRPTPIPLRLNQKGGQ